MNAPKLRSQRTGLGYAIAAYLAWGTFPIYFHALGAVPPLEVLAHRIVWSAVFVGGLVTLGGRWGEVALALRPRRRLLTYALSSVLICANWLLYIRAVGNGQVLEASLGYFINPLVNVLLGVLFLRERLRPRQTAAMLLAAAGVLVLVVRLGVVPWLSLALALTFGAYALVRKKADLDPVVGLLIETALVAPFAAALLADRGLHGTGHLGHGLRVSLLLLSAGVVTALPLIWFAHGVRSLRLSTMGLMQYVTPTLQFLCAVVLFHEPFTAAHGAAFACIWLSLALYTADALVGQRQ